jgi:replicative DNA helicase
VGGVAYIASLTEGLPRRVSIEEYVRIVKNKALLRQLIHICHTTATSAADQSEEALEVLNAAESALLQVSESGITRDFADIPAIVKQHFGTIDSIWKLKREVTGLATHFKDFDRMTSGLQAASSSSSRRAHRWAKRPGPSTSRSRPRSRTARLSASSRWKCRANRSSAVCSRRKPS